MAAKVDRARAGIGSAGHREERLQLSRVGSRQEQRPTPSEGFDALQPEQPGLPADAPGPVIARVLEKTHGR